MNQIIHVREGADSVRPVEIEAFTLAPEAADPFQEAPSGR
jgi:hypothetical protein